MPIVITIWLVRNNLFSLAFFIFFRSFFVGFFLFARERLSNTNSNWTWVILIAFTLKCIPHTRTITMFLCRVFSQWNQLKCSHTHNIINLRKIMWWFANKSHYNNNYALRQRFLSSIIKRMCHSLLKCHWDIWNMRSRTILCTAECAVDCICHRVLVMNIAQYVLEIRVIYQRYSRLCNKYYWTTYLLLL